MLRAHSLLFSIENMQCLLCSLPLEKPISRRIIAPQNPSNSNVTTFFVQNVYPQFKFTVGEVYYVCKSACYKRIEKATKMQASLNSLLMELKSLFDTNNPLKISSACLFDQSLEQPGTSNEIHSEVSTACMWTDVYSVFKL